MDMKTCRTCNITKELSEFGIRNRNLDGYDNQCKLCFKEYQREYLKGYRIKEKENVKDSMYIDFKGVRLTEWCQTYRILSKIGYNPEIDIHTQFLERHPNLVYKERPLRNRKLFSWEDCK